MTCFDVSVLIVSHGHADLVRDCLATLNESMVGLTYEIVLIDNLREADFLQKVGGARPQMTVLQNDDRMGFGANMNKAARIAVGRVLLLLNPDTKYHAGQIADAIGFLEGDVSRGIVAARLLNNDLSDQRNFRSFPSMWIAVLRGFGADRWQWRPSFYRKSLLEGMNVDAPTRVDWVYGSFMLIRKSVFDAFGGFDEGFFMYYEDVDLCFRLRKAGLETFVYPHLEFVHHHFRTSAESPHGSHRKYHIKSLARYLWKSNGFLIGPQISRRAKASTTVGTFSVGAPTNALAPMASPSSMRPLLQLAYTLSMAGATIAASILAWQILALLGWISGPVDNVAKLVTALYIACIVITQFMLQELDSARLGDARRRMIGATESSIVAAFPVALFAVAFGNAIERWHDIFILLLVAIAIPFNAVASLVFASLVSSEGARIGLVIDKALADRAIRAPELPIGLQVVSEIFLVSGPDLEEVTERLSDAIRAESIDGVLLFTARAHDQHVPQLVRGLSMFDIPIWHAQTGENHVSRPLQLRGPMRSRAREGLKRGFDLLFSLAALAVLFVPMLVIAAAIKIDDSGPAFFRQPRLGRNQVPFMMLKFRSMHFAKNDIGANELTKRGDARITRVGAFLRRTSLDELPQFINVVKGEMSIVGPRPLPVGFHFKGDAFERLVPDWHHRYRVRSGITGLSQVKGFRGTPEDLSEACKMMHDRVKYDNLYIDQWSIWLDLNIVIMTIVGGAFRSRAY